MLLCTTQSWSKAFSASNESQGDYTIRRGSLYNAKDWREVEKFGSVTKRQCMSTEIPGDLLPFVQRMVAAKRFLNEGDVVAEGLRLLQAREALREEVRKGFEQLDAGRGIPAEQVFARLEQRILDIENGTA